MPFPESLQDWAFSSLDFAPNDRFAKNLVALELRAAGEGVTALQLAYETNAKHFLTHWACEEVIDQQWRSGSRDGVTIELPSNFSWLLLLLQALFPLCNVLLWYSPPEPEKPPEYNHNSFFRALRVASEIPVSYTHLTLPTILLV